MTLKHFLKSAVVGIAVAALVLIVGVAGEVAWLTLGLPGVHRTTVAPRTNVAAGTPSGGGIRVNATLYDRSDTISESDADISVLPSYILAGVGLMVGFRWAYRRDSARALRGQSGQAS
jgi:hypothetical protein